MSEKLPTVILPGYLASAEDYRQLADILQQLGFPTAIVPNICGNVYFLESKCQQN